MGKFQTEEDYARVLFSKKSFSSFSRTLSTLSNHTRNTVRRKASVNKGFYTDKGKVKRDLSIETDLCAIRRRFKEQLKQLLNADANSIIHQRSQKSAKSRYSDFTEAAAEYERDESASGDNSYDKPDANRCCRGPFPINKEHLLYKNFNKLVETWIQQILKDNEVQTKIQKVLLKSLRPKDVALLNKKTSSGTTYILETDECNDVNGSKSSERDSSGNQYFNDDHSVSMVPTAQTIPLIYETIRLISTLSLPRNITRKKIQCNKRKHKIRTKRYRIKTEPHNLWFVTLQMEENDKSGTSIDLLEYPTTALLQSFASWDQKSLPSTKFKKSPEPSLLVQRRRPVPVNTMPKESSVSENVDPIFSKNEKTKLIQSVYKDSLKPWIQPKIYNPGPRSKNYANEFPIVETHKKATNKKCNETNMISCQATVLCEGDQNDHNMVTVDYLAHKLACREKLPINVNVKRENDTGLQEITGMEPNLVQNKSHTPSTNVLPRYAPSIKVCKRRYRRNVLTRRIEDILGYSMKSEKVPKLDIHVNIFPNKEFSTGTSQAEIDTNTNQQNGACIAVVPGQTYAEGDVKKKKNCSLMPLLDGAESKYFIKTDSLSKPEKQLNTTISKDQASMTTDLGLREEFNEIKAKLKTITHLVSKVGQIETNKCTSPNSSKSIQVEAKSFKKCNSFKKKSQGMQVLKGLSSGIKQKKTSGFTFKKQGKINNKNDRLVHREKSTASYKIINSESVIQITEMDKSVSDKTLRSVALTCSMPQRKSLYEVSSVMKAAGDMSKSKVTPSKDFISTKHSKNQPASLIIQSKHQPVSPIIRLSTLPNVHNTVANSITLKTDNVLNTSKPSYSSTHNVISDDHYSVKKESDQAKNSTNQNGINKKFCLTLNPATQSHERRLSHSDSSTTKPPIEPAIHKTVKKAKKRCRQKPVVKCISSVISAEKPNNDTEFKKASEKESESTELMVHDLSEDVVQSCHVRVPPSKQKLLEACKIFPGRREEVSGKWSTYGDSIGKNRIPFRHSMIVTRRFITDGDSHCLDMLELSSSSCSVNKGKKEASTQILVNYIGSLIAIVIIIGLVFYCYNTYNDATDLNEKINITTNYLKTTNFFNLSNLTELGF